MTDRRGRPLYLRVPGDQRDDRTSYTVMCLLSGDNIILTVSISPNEDRMSLQYVRHLTASERQFLNIT